MVNLKEYLKTINLRRIMFVVLGILSIILILKCQITETTWQRSNKEIELKKQGYKTELSQEEINAFIRVWPEFKKLGFADDLIVSYKIDSPSKFIDWKTQIWFVYHKWDADRFFYVQQRLVSLLHSLGVKRNAHALIAHLEKRNDDLSKDMILLQKRRIEAEEGTSKELEMVAEKETVLRKMFE